MAAGTDFKEFLQGLPLPWLVGGPVGQAEAGAIGDVLDDQTDQLDQARKASMPGKGPLDALPHIAADRQLIRGPSETDDQFRLRLKFAWEQWAWAGSALGVLCQLYYQGYGPYAVLVTQNGLAHSLTGTLPAFVPGQPWDPTANLVITNLGTNPTLPSSPSWWSFDLQNSFCSRYALVFYNLPPSWTSIVSPPTTSSAPSLSDINTLRSILKTWAAGKATCVSIIARTSGKILGWPTTQTLGTGTLGGSTVVFTP